jgi:uncharacterized protein (DUF58 family)
MLPTKRTVKLVLLGAPTALLPVFLSVQWWPIWAAVWATLLIGMGVDWVLTPRRSQMTVEVSAPPSIYLGQRERGEAIVRFRGVARPWTVEIRVDLSDTLETQPATRYQAEEGRIAFEIPLLATRRGKAHIENVWLRCTGPLGLGMRVFVFQVDCETHAVPDGGLLQRFSIEHFSAREFLAGLKVERYQGEGSELDSLREYLPGMDHRRIDWKTSARHLKLLCPQFKAERSHQIVLALDTGRLMGEAIDKLPRLDHAIHSALLMTYLCARSGDRLGFYSFGAHPGAFYPARGGLAAAKNVMHLAGELDYGELETNYAWSLASLTRDLKRRSLVVVFTDFVDTATADVMVEHLHRMSRRHLVIFVAFTDPLLTEAAGAFPKRMESIHRALVADNMLHERGIVFRKLTRMGVHCIDASPAQVSLRLINKYLEIKRREMI